MTVEQLRHALLDYPPNARVVVFDSNYDLAMDFELVLHTDPTWVVRHHGRDVPPAICISLE